MSGGTAVIMGIVFNVTSTVGIVLLNKYIWEVDDFKFMVFLSACHFGFTALCCRVFNKLGLFEHKPSPVVDILPVALGSLGSVAFMNLNLAYNTVGFYQLSKLVCIPVTIGMQYFMSGATVSNQIAGSLVVILIGVGIATSADVGVNFLGTMYAAAAVFCTVLGQIFTSSKQASLNMDHMQLLNHTSPLIAVGMLILSPFFESTSDLMNARVALPTFGRICFTCMLAVVVNISNYMVLGKTSPVTYQVMGHFKTITILVLGFMVYQYPVNPNNVFGILIALTGVITYSELKRRGSAPRQPSKSDTVEMVGLLPGDKDGDKQNRV